MFHQTGEICRFCETALDPEQVYRVPVPLFDRTYELCARCKDAFARGDRELEPFEPGFRADRIFRWGHVLPEDVALVLERVAREASAPAAGEGSLEGGEIELARVLGHAARTGEDVLPLDALSRLVDRKAKGDALPLLFGVYAHATAGPPLEGSTVKGPLDARRRAHLEAARSAYVLHLPWKLRDELDARIAALHAIATLELADVSSAEAKLREYRRQADANPKLRDPRIPLSQALVQLANANLAAVDDSLKVGVAWAGTDAKWAGVEALLQFDVYVRAVDSGRWEVAKDALKRFVKLRPGDRRALFDLAHTFMRCALDPVAREVLASYHALDPRDEDGVLLYATCLSRVGETHAAWVLLRDDLEHERDSEKLGAERRHLAALLAHAEGHRDRALELMTQAHALAPDDRTRGNLVFLVQEALAEMIESLPPERFPELVELLRAHGAVLKAEYGEIGLGFVESFCVRELRDGFRAAPDFGLDLFDKVKFRDAEATALQAWRFLAQRKLGDAVRKSRASQSAGGRPLPIGLVLAFLEQVRRWPEEARGSIFPPKPAS